jgi:hypothetical protein
LMFQGPSGTQIDLGFLGVNILSWEACGDQEVNKQVKDHIEPHVWFW